MYDKQLYVYWKPEKRNAVWRVCRKDAVPDKAMFTTSMAFEKEPDSDEFKDLLNRAVVRYGDLTLDFDSNNKELSLADARKAGAIFIDMGVSPKDMDFFFSGKKGFHIVVPAELFGAEEGDPFLPLIYKSLVMELFDPSKSFKYLDLSMFAMRKGKMFRLANKKRENGFFKIPLTWEELNGGISLLEMWTLAKAPRYFADRKSPVTSNAVMKRIYTSHKTSVLDHIRKRVNVLKKGEQVLLTPGTKLPCLKNILSMRFKSGSYSFNKIVFAALVPALKEGGFTLQSSLQDDEVLDFLNEFEESTAYPDAQSRLDHFESCWNTDDKNIKSFSCGAMYNIYPDRLGCSGCPRRVIELFSDINEPEPDIKPVSEADVQSGNAPERVHPAPVIDPFIEEMNKRYAYITIGTRDGVIDESSLTGDQVDILNIDVFMRLTANLDKIEIIDDNGKVKLIPAGKYWLESKHRRTYRGMDFCVDETKLRNGFYNQWRGLEVSKDKSSISKEEVLQLTERYRNHVNHIICGGNWDVSEYLWKWMAHLVQKTHEKPGVAVIVRGGEGTGKSIFVKPLLTMLGSYGKEVGSRQQIFSQFNSTLEGCVLAYLDESFWAGNKNEEGILKNMITSSTLAIQRKGFDYYEVPSVTRFIMTSNEEWVVPASSDSRRFLVMEASNEVKQDLVYFGALAKSLKHPSFTTALYRYLKDLDITDFNPLNLPKTKELVKQKSLSLSPVDEWIRDVLSTGDFGSTRLDDPENMSLFLPEKGEWPVYITPAIIRDSFKNGGFSQTIKGRYWSKDMLTRRFISLCHGGLSDEEVSGMSCYVTLGGKKTLAYPVPPLDVCHTMFEKVTSTKV